MDNPWLDVDGSEGWIHPADRQVVHAYNASLAEARRERFALDTSLSAAPWSGDLDAPVLLLLANPGSSTTHAAVEARPGFRELLVANLRQTPDRPFPLPYLHPEFADTHGGRWWRKTTRALAAAAGGDFGVVARTVCAVEFHPYHSRGYDRLPVTLPTQRYTFAMVERAVARGAVVVLLRCRIEWLTAVPSLQGYEGLHRPRSAQQSAVSPKNTPEAWPAVLAAIERIAASTRGPTNE